MPNPSSPLPVPNPDENLEWWLKALPPLRAALISLWADKPLTASGKHAHSPFWTFIALVLGMALLMLVLLAGEGAPYIPPHLRVWDLGFKLFIDPNPDWFVLLLCTTTVFGAGLVPYCTSWWVGKKLSQRSPKNQPAAIQLTRFSTIGAVLIYILAMLLVYGVGWLLVVIDVRVHVLFWMSAAAVLAVPGAAWFLWRVFQRTRLPNVDQFGCAMLIATSTYFASACGAMIVMQVLNKGMSSYGQQINRARQLPVAAVVQACEPSGETIACAVTLYPVRWQAYELIGNWQLGTIDERGKVLARVSWTPNRSEGQYFPIVAVEADKANTIEIRTPIGKVCGSPGALAATDNFFAVKARIRDVQRLVSDEIHIRVDNMPPVFSDMVKAACPKD